MPHTFVEDIKSKLPEYAILVLGSAKAFLISKVFEVVNEILDKLKDTCPPPETIKKLVKSINSVKAVVASIEKKIDKIEKLTPILDAAIVIIKIYLDFQYHLRPDFVTLPITGYPGTPTGAKRQTQINNLQRKIRNTERVLKDLTAAKKTITLAVATTKTTLGPILGIIQIIESLLEACLTNQSLTDEERRSLIQGIQDKTDNILIRGIEYTSAKGTTYTIKITSDPNSPQIAPKRQAIAQDFRGITVLTGPSSFASDPNILIEELKFRIDNQLP